MSTGIQIGLVDIAIQDDSLITDTTIVIPSGPVAFEFSDSTAFEFGGPVYPPAIPTLNVTPDYEYGALKLTWTPDLDNNYTYVLQRSTDDSSWGTIATLNGVNEYRDTGLTPGTPLYYRINAANAVGTSLYSASVNDVPFTVSASNAASASTTPTSDTSGEAIHPSVYDAGSGNVWPTSGSPQYRYWMAMTPFTNGSAAVERPEILGSSDGDTWVVPTGLTNPIATPSRTHLADTELLHAQDDNLYCYYVDVTEATPDTVDIKVKSSSTGTSWSGSTTLITLTDSCASPSVLWNGSQYIMWYINYHDSAKYTLKRRVSSSPDSGWGGEIECNVRNIPAGELIWNIHMVYDSGNYYALIGMFADPKDLYFARSDDGITWYITDDPLLEPGTGGNWDDGKLYRACSIVKTGGFDMWYSGDDQAGAWNNPHIGMTSITYG